MTELRLTLYLHRYACFVGSAGGEVDYHGNHWRWTLERVALPWLVWRVEFLEGHIPDGPPRDDPIRVPR